LNSGVIDKITIFLNTIGLEVVMRSIDHPTFLPGLMLENGKIIADPDKLQFPGDLLHEAGHLASIPPDVRKTISGPIPDSYVSGGYELMALAWSYAACLHIGLDPSVVFHDGGYKGEGNNLLETFANGSYIGLPMLQYLGLAYDKNKSAELGILPYPNMVSWLNENKPVI
jgi:hypothetical protein